MSFHNLACSLTQNINDTYIYNSPWWVYFIAAFALFGLGVNIWIGVSVLLKALGFVVTIKKPSRNQEPSPAQTPHKGTAKQKPKKEKQDPLDKLS